MNLLRSPLILLLVMLSLAIAGCAGPSEQSQAGERIQTVATFYPLYEIVKSVGGDKVDAISLVPNGVEPHDYDPTPRQIADIGNARAVAVLGVGFESLENKLIGGASKNATIITVSDGVQILGVSGEVDSGESTGKDPHIWLSPKNMVIMTGNVRDGLEKADPANAAYYEKNAQDYTAELGRLDAEYRAGLAHCNKSTILVTHNAFQYMSREYGFSYIAISGVSPEAEPTPQKMAELVDTAREYNITYIFYEELVDPRIADTIAGEVGAQAMELSPLEGTKNQSDDYFSIMRRNLKNLRAAMECA